MKEIEDQLLFHNHTALLTCCIIKYLHLKKDSNLSSPVDNPIERNNAKLKQHSHLQCGSTLYSCLNCI